MNKEQEHYIKNVDKATGDDIFIKNSGREGINLPPHSHNRTQIVLTMQGTLHVMVDNREYFVPEGHICWIPSGMTHSLSSNNRQIAIRIYYVSLHFPKKSPGNEFAVYNDNPWAIANFHYIDSHGSVISCQNKGLHEFCMAFFRLLPDVCQRYVLPLKGIAVGTDPILRKALAYIHSNLSDNLKQEDVANAVGTSSRSLSRLFQDAGISFTGYLNYQRIIRSLELMADKTMTMREIAYATGFSAPANFNRTFKQIMGVSPTEMKRGTSV